MKIRKRLATPSGDLPLVYEDVRLELSAPGDVYKRQTFGCELLPLGVL